MSGAASLIFILILNTEQPSAFLQNEQLRGGDERGDIFQVTGGSFKNDPVNCYN